MAVFNGSHAVASTTAAATLVRTQMQTTIPSHANWTLVESTTMNAGAVPCDVYKCSSVGNGLGADYYAAVMQSGVNLYFGIAEGYNTTTHKPKRPAVHSPVTLNTLQADGGFMSATTEIDWFNGTFNPGGAAGTAMASVATNAAYSGAQIDDWKVMVGADCFYFVARSTAYYGYVGPYDSLVATPATNDPLPLVMVQCQLASSQAIHTAALRQPLCGSQSIGYATNCNGGGSGGSEAAATLSSILWLQPGEIGTVGSGTTADNSDLYAGGVTVIRRAVITNSFVAGSATVGRDKNGYARGLYRRLRVLGAAVTGLTFGDQITVDGAIWVFVQNNLVVEYNPA